MKAKIAIEKMEKLFAKYKKVQIDIDSFDGDKRGHYQALINFEEDIIELCQKIVKTGLE